MATSLPLKYHGGKKYLASKIISLMPSHLTYCEPYAGGLAVLLHKSYDGISEVVNDINQELTNFWCVLQNESSFENFRRRIEATPFSEVEFRGAVKVPVTSSLERAVSFFIRCRQSLAGRQKDFATVSTTRTRRKMNEQVSAWLTAVEGLSEVHARLKRVLILNRDGALCIRQHDGAETLFYVDAPYVAEARSSPDIYEHEMTDEQHKELIDTLLACEGKVLVSMYHHPIYDVLHQKHGWFLKEFKSPNHAAGGEAKRIMTECVWANYRPPGT